MIAAILERCCTDTAQVREALENGASRAELCRCLETGGLTPDTEEIRKAVATGLQVNVLVRPRSGDFLYDAAEAAKMLEDIGLCAELGAGGVVVGALDKDGNVDAQLCAAMAEKARSLGLETTFHRAFDSCREPLEALETIISLGYDRILTSGCRPTAMEGAPLLAELVLRAAGRIIIMPGSGVSPENIDRLRELTGATEFHGTRLCVSKD